MTGWLRLMVRKLRSKLLDWYTRWNPEEEARAIAGEEIPRLFDFTHYRGQSLTDCRVGVLVLTQTRLIFHAGPSAGLSPHSINLPPKTLSLKSMDIEHVEYRKGGILDRLYFVRYADSLLVSTSLGELLRFRVPRATEWAALLTELSEGVSQE